MIRKIRDKIAQDVYLKNFLTLFSGTAFVQILPFFTAPITTRIYDPVDYGYTAMYNAVIGLFTIFIFSHYVHFIIIADRKKDIVNVLFLSLYIAVIITILLFLVVYLVPRSFLDQVLAEEYFVFLYLMPLVVFLMGYGQIINTWNNKQGKYSLMSKIRIANALLTVGIIISVGLLVDGPYGLFISIIFSPLLTSIISTYFFIREDRKFLRLVSFRWLIHLMKREKRYALFIFPSDLINKYINLLPLFVVESLGGKVNLGNYQFSQRILGMLIQFIGTSVLEVFRKKAIDEYNSEGNCLKTFKRTFKILAGLSIVPSLILLCFAPEIFQFVFGDRWYGAGQITQALSVLYFFKMVSSPLSYVYYIARKTREDLITQVGLVILNLLALALGYFYFEDVFTMVLLYALSYSAIYALQLVRSYHFAKGNLR